MTTPENDTTAKLLPCPWGCAPQREIEAVSGPEPNFPDRQRPIIFCRHARIKGDRRLAVGAIDWRDLAIAWNTRPAPDAADARVKALEEALRECVGSLRIVVAERFKSRTFPAAQADYDFAMGPVSRAEAALAMKPGEGA